MLFRSEDVRRLTNLYVAPDWVLRLPEAMKKRVADKYQYIISGWKQKICKKKEQNHYRCHFHNSFEDVVFHLNLGHDWYLDGLWQNLDYFRECMKEIYDAFSFSNVERLRKEDKRILKEIEETNSVSVHVRRGDFVNSKFDICNRGYYDRAMNLMAGMGENYYYFFTDDIPFVEKEFANIGNKKVISHDAAQSIVDLRLMSACRNHIISNSTFSYWAAFLHQSKDKVVIAPKYSLRNAIGAFELSALNEWKLLDV